MSVIRKKLEEAIFEAESASTRLSEMLILFDLRNIPHCEKDLNQADIGTKIRVAKFVLSILKAGE